jgi:molecular chaperone GrpE
MTQKPRAADPEVTGSAPGGSAPADRREAAAERVVIRDKRKIGKAEADAGGAEATTNKSSDGTEQPAAAGSEATADTTPASGGKPAPAGAEDVEVEIEAVIEAEQPVEAAAVEGGALGAELAALRTELDERTRDLQRISAEYANYRKRVDRDRGLVAEQMTGTVLAAVLPVLDDIDRARDHGDLVGPFGTVAEQLTAALGKFGLTAFGEKGDRFDPTRHEAVAHLTSADVSEPTCVDVMRRGYLLGERLLRPALVAVADPE